MKTYRYWAKAAAENQPAGKLVECFGCSNESVQAALADAQVRANKISDAMQSGSVSDQYSYGKRPVREEIVEDFEHDNRLVAVITRNTYGALVLNTPRTLFADIDYREEPMSVGGLISSLFGKRKPSQDEQVIARIEELVAQDGSLGVRVYRTKNGFRCLVKSRTYDPLSEESHRLLRQLESDPKYVQLCQVQECYRARISPKPWRCGLDTPPARFPFRDDQIERVYREWQSAYEERAKSYCACALIGDFGAADVHPEVDLVMQLHDHFACADDRPLC